MTAARPKCNSDREFTRAAARPREHQAGNIQARNKQNEADRTEKYEYRCLHVAGRKFGVRNEEHAPAGILRVTADRLILLYAADENAHPRLSLVESDAATQACYGKVRFVHSISRREGGLRKTKRNIDVLCGVAEFRRHHSNNFVGHLV